MSAELFNTGQLGSFTIYRDMNFQIVKESSFEHHSHRELVEDFQVMLRTTIAILSISLLSACLQTSEPVTNFNDDPVPIPDPIRIVGAAGPVATAAAELRADGINVETSFTGRAAGLTAFCSGEADALALIKGQGFRSEERAHCQELKDGWSWSALSTKQTQFYVRFSFAQDLIDRTPTAR